MIEAVSIGQEGKLYPDHRMIAVGALVLPPIEEVPVCLGNLHDIVGFATNMRRNKETGDVLFDFDFSQSLENGIEQFVRTLPYDITFYANEVEHHVDQDEVLVYDKATLQEIRIHLSGANPGVRIP